MSEIIKIGRRAGKWNNMKDLLIQKVAQINNVEIYEVEPSYSFEYFIIKPKSRSPYIYKLKFKEVR